MSHSKLLCISGQNYWLAYSSGNDSVNFLLLLYTEKRQWKVCGVVTVNYAVSQSQVTMYDIGKVNGAIELILLMPLFGHYAKSAASCFEGKLLFSTCFEPQHDVFYHYHQINFRSSQLLLF